MANEKTVRVRLVKGLRGVQSRHRLSVKALGLNKLNDVRELKDSPQVRGLINTVYYLVMVEGTAGPIPSVCGTYADELVKQPDAWRFRRRELIHAFKGEMALTLPPPT